MLSSIKILEKGSAQPLYVSFVENQKHALEFLNNASNAFGKNSERCFVTGFINDRVIFGNLADVIKDLQKVKGTFKKSKCDEECSK